MFTEAMIHSLNNYQESQIQLAIFFGLEFLALFIEINTNLILLSCHWLTYNCISFINLHAAGQHSRIDANSSQMEVISLCQNTHEH